jgi:hypothetical protein
VSSKRRIRRKSCKGKQRFDTLDAAWTACRRVIRHNAKKGYGTGPMNAYGCRFCGGFHFGHSPARAVRNGGQ